MILHMQFSQTLFDPNEGQWTDPDDVLRLLTGLCQEEESRDVQSGRQVFPLLQLSLVGHVASSSTPIFRYRWWEVILQRILWGQYGSKTKMLSEKELFRQFKKIRICSEKKKN